MQNLPVGEFQFSVLASIWKTIKGQRGTLICKIDQQDTFYKICLTSSKSSSRLLNGVTAFNDDFQHFLAFRLI